MQHGFVFEQRPIGSYLSRISIPTSFNLNLFRRSGAIQCQAHVQVPDGVLLSKRPLLQGKHLCQAKPGKMLRAWAAMTTDWISLLVRQCSSYHSPLLNRSRQYISSTTLGGCGRVCDTPYSRFFVFPTRRNKARNSHRLSWKTRFPWYAEGCVDRAKETPFSGCQRRLV